MAGNNLFLFKQFYELTIHKILILILFNCKYLFILINNLNLNAINYDLYKFLFSINSYINFVKLVFFIESDEELINQDLEITIKDDNVRIKQFVVSCYNDSIKLHTNAL